MLNTFPSFSFICRSSVFLLLHRIIGPLLFGPNVIFSLLHKFLFIFSSIVFLRYNFVLVVFTCCFFSYRRVEMEFMPKHVSYANNSSIKLKGDQHIFYFLFLFVHEFGSSLYLRAAFFLLFDRKKFEAFLKKEEDNYRGFSLASSFFFFIFHNFLFSSLQ